PYVKRYWRLSAMSGLLIGLGALVTLAIPWPLAIVIDTVLGDRPLPAIFGSLLSGSGKYTLLAFAVVFGLLLTAAQHLVSVGENYANTKLEQHIVLDFRSDLFRHVKRLALPFHDITQSGGLMYKVTMEADAAGSVVLAVPPLIQNVITLVLMFFV